MQQRNGRTLARLDLSLRLLVFLALAMVAPTFPVQALAQSNDITLSLGGTLSQSQAFEVRQLVRHKLRQTSVWELTTAVVSGRRSCTALWRNRICGSAQSRVDRRNCDGPAKLRF